MMVLEIFDQIFGKDRTSVDSSKYLFNMKVLYEMPAIDLKMLHLRRGVREWRFSACKAARRHQRFYLKDLVKIQGWKAGFGYLNRTWFGLRVRWFKNKGCKSALKATRSQRFS